MPYAEKFIIIRDESGDYYKSKISYFRPWNRFNSFIEHNIDSTNYDMRRKAEILKYNNKESKAIQISRMSRGVNKFKKKQWISKNNNLPNVLGNNINTHNLQIGQRSVLKCPNVQQIKAIPTSASNVPKSKKVSALYLNPQIPVIRYNNPNRKMFSGANKFPQTSWKPGSKGFPVGKKGTGTKNYYPNERVYTEIFKIIC